MITFSRAKDQRFRIGDNIVITITEIRGKMVRIGIEVPAHIPVRLEEAQETIQQEKEKGEDQAAGLRRLVADQGKGETPKP